MTDQLKTSGFWYLASPYTHPDLSVRQQRAVEVNMYSGKLLALGVHVYSPIWATHRVNLRHRLPTDHLFWLAFNKAFIDPAVGIVVCDIDGWRESKGCQQEIEYARETGKPVWLCDDRLNLSAL
ncbi:DUF1937 family protein [Ensifer aridi]|uniref:DUF1937 family protein n=1 Tax=Ensifer aridi TaxID=1708715 RepID=UPI0015E33F53|nr:DUF1937 family protein [Ensifer aridi]